ncbi:MAG: hypothetical protein E7B96_13715 [Clostridium perfringens]|uniref:hypothetical protein n=1 Tax=Clostridium perfringens TaxID=1502 RepID=UPI0010949D49|nr:hypothetical protein [Clostridium perfringens]MDU2749508.1 hypothetical protein [Clostridium perfringens]MDU2867513.1 hypothetical protein [Clostridium perfringens]TGY42478.1 hypothetical protein E5346_14300 [Clostridium perfringens]
MGRLSKIKNAHGIPDDYKKQFSTCLFCNEEISEGGYWAGDINAGVCKECSYYLIDLLIDTLNDTDVSFKKSSVDSKVNYIERIVRERAMKKEKDEKYSCLKELHLRYYAEVGIIDFFDGTMTISEIMSRFSENDLYDSEALRGCENEIKELIYDISNEYPHTIRFFVIPDLNYGMFRLGCVAKIDNNGSTYVLCGNKKYFEAIDEPGYCPTVEKIY